MSISHLLLAALAALQRAGDWELRSTCLGPEAYGNFGSAMSRLGDLDDDGVDEIIVGDYASSYAGPLFGAVHVFSGRAGTRLYSVTGDQNSLFGATLSRVGDLDADGFEDFVVGATSASFSMNAHEGAVYVYSGISGNRLAVIPGIPNSSSGDFGISMSGIGDFNGDGHDDFIAGDYATSILPNSAGFAWVLSGRDFSVLHTIVNTGWYGTGGALLGISDLTGDGRKEILIRVGRDVSLLSGADFTEIRRHVSPNPNDGFGNRLAEIGDLDQDGFTDYAVNAPVTAKGQVYVYSGGTGAQLAVLHGTYRDGEFSWSLAGPGDVDGDGYPDILVGAPEQGIYERYNGAAHLFSGYDFQRIHVFLNIHPWTNRIGESVASAGDVDGDGLMDFHVASTSTHGDLPYAGVVRCYGLRSYLQPSTRSVSAAVGGTMDFVVDFPDSVGSLRYAILASSGPGRTLIRGERIPLNATPLLNLSLNSPPAIFPGAQGTLDPSGDASATLTLAPHAAAAWAGRTLKFSAVALDPTGAVQAYSAAMPLAVEP